MEIVIKISKEEYNRMKEKNRIQSGVTGMMVGFRIHIDRLLMPM